MKVILHGATNSSNFGDFLFAKMFYDKMEEINNGNNLFYEFPKFGIGKFYRRYIPYYKKMTYRHLKNADLLIYFSGGYFGETTSTLKETIIRYIRYFMIGRYFIKRNKKIAIIGVGGGPISNNFLRKTVCKIMEKSQIIIVRDQETADYFKQHGVKKNILITTDTVLSFDLNNIPKLEQETSDKVKKSKKSILVHLYGNKKIDEDINKKIIPDLNKFLESHNDYAVFVSYDGIPKDENEYEFVFNNIKTTKKYYYQYEDPMQFCAFLSEMDIVITPKLHVGIFSYILEKSILSFPMHPEKTKRFYKMINKKERCIPLDDLKENEVYELLEEYCNKKIKKDEKLINTAKINLKELETIISK